MANKKTFVLAISILFMIGVGVAYTQQIPNPGHGGDSVLVSVDGFKMTLQEAINYGVLVDGASAPTQDYTTEILGAYQAGDEIYVSVDGDETTLQEAILTSLCGGDSYSYGSNINMGHSANEVLVSAGDIEMTLQNAINSGEFCYVQKATGGTITSSGEYTIHTFTSSGTFIANVAMNVEVLVVGGGGGADGGGDYVYDHGGAGGTVRTAANMPITTKSYAVLVGAGGAGGTREVNGGTGGSSSFNGLVAAGGGGGVVRPSGHGGNNADYLGVVASYPAGGGGAGAGGNGGQGGVCGGGVGVHSSISGADIGYGGGGMGINNCGTSYATDGGGSSSAGVNGRGGGGGTLLHMGQNGGSGIVIIRYLK